MSRDFLHKPFAPLVLPAVYDDVLSYEEWLSKVIYRLNEIQEYIDDTIADIDTLVATKVTQALVPVNQSINSLRAKVTELDRKLDDAVDYLEDEIAEQVKVVADSVTTLESELYRLGETLRFEYKKADSETLADAIAYTNRKYSNIKIETLGLIAELEERIDDIIKEYPHLYDPATGNVEDMQTVINETYTALRYHALTALLYDDQEWTASEYDDLGFTAIQYDTDALMVIIDKLKNMFNPFTGKHESVKEVLIDLISRLKWNSKTTSEYDGYHFTAEEFDNSDFGAYTQDTNKYYTTPVEDNKNKKYRNFLLVAEDSTGIDTVEMLVRESTEIYAVYPTFGGFSFPLESGTYTDPNGDSVTVSIQDDVANLTFVGDPTRVYAVTYVKDVSELSK